MTKNDFVTDIVKQLGLKKYQRDVQKYVGDFIKAETKRKKQVALLIDGPNIMRKEFNVDLGEVRKKALKLGELKVSKVFLNQFAKEKLIEAVATQGFEPVMSISEDVDVDLAVEAMEVIHDPHIDILVLVTRDADYLSVIRRAKAYNKTVVIFGVQPGFSVALKNAADSYAILGKRRLLRRLRRR